ncbi:MULTISPECIES: uracil-DNA glycosylase [unclassified Mycoplasma]|uniref:uracil-DNA glycosylase n=1 Tax=unclassified Mycoplasma TaxID=2683645 RepID=UPI00211BA2BE|nr:MULTISPECIES: uracil-DNA glycosylase [unclassified Mycoplasma]UUM19608.1 uracil-DNA glycosylase [Mycoplasma sp. 1578d]UUM24578.1 uracil-DNA glycosylase [Mycoplasma sp. 3686d]
MKDSFLQILQSEGKKPYFENIINGLRNYITFDIVPHQMDMFRAFEFFQVHETKVIILGQDPYHSKNVADGLAFSTRSKKTPPSLQNIFKELSDEFPNISLNSNDLTPWAKQGVLLLNVYLTTVINKPLEHQHLGWEQFAQVVCEKIVQANPNVVFLALGRHAQEFITKLHPVPQYVLKTSHPSPFSANKGFLGSRIFIKANELLKQNNISPINWELKEVK